MIQTIEKTKCCGCTACYSACPRKAITMKEDFEGFLYPYVTSDLCIGCGLCNKACPIENPPHVDGYDREAFAIRAKEPEILKNSTSGGFISPLAKWIWNRNGVVCAAIYDNDLEIAHVCAEKLGGVLLFRGFAVPNMFRADWTIVLRK